MKLLLLFNSSNKEFIGFGAFGQEEIIKGNLLYKEVEFEQDTFNLARYTWEGDYDNGKIVDLQLKNPIVTERGIIDKNLNILVKKYGLDFFIIEGLYFLDKKNEFLVDFSEICAKIEKEKEHFSKSSAHEYKTLETEQKEIEKALHV